MTVMQGCDPIVTWSPVLCHLRILRITLNMHVESEAESSYLRSIFWGSGYCSDFSSVCFDSFQIPVLHLISFKLQVCHLQWKESWLIEYFWGTEFYGQEKRDMGAFILLENFFTISKYYIYNKNTNRNKNEKIYCEKMCIRDIEQYRGQYLQKSKCTGTLFMCLFLILGLAKVWE